jgi:hypothetical protein
MDRLPEQAFDLRLWLARAVDLAVFFWLAVHWSKCCRTFGLSRGGCYYYPLFRPLLPNRTLILELEPFWDGFRRKRAPILMEPNITDG